MAKGKEVANKACSGKRKHCGAFDEDKTGGGQKRNNRGVLQFFEDSAAEIGESDESFFGDGFMEEDFEVEPEVQNDQGKAQSFPFIPKEEEMNEAEFDRMMEERFKAGSSFVTYSEYENKRLVERNSLPLSAKDPIIWKVKCAVGRERFSAFCLMQKFVDMKSLGTKLQIVSAFSSDHIKGAIYMEAYKQSDINEACKGLSSIYSSRIAMVPENEVSQLLSYQSKCSEVVEGMWARVKNGIYKGDLAQIVAVNNSRKRATVKLVPRIDLKLLAVKYGGGGSAKKKSSTPAPRLISSSELEEFRPLIQYRRDRETGKHFEFLDGLMFKDGYLYKKVSLDSLICWSVVPTEEEILKFKPSEINESDDLEWLSQLYGNQNQRRVIKTDGLGGKGEGSSGFNKGLEKGEGSSGVDKGGDQGESSSGVDNGGGKGEGSSRVDKGGGGKGQGSSGVDKGGGKGKRPSGVGKGGKGEGSLESNAMNNYEVHDFVCFGRMDFGVILGVERDESYKILKYSQEGPKVVYVQKKDLKGGPSGTKFTTVDKHKKAISLKDTVKVLEGLSKDRQGIVKHIYRHIVFIRDENEVENDGYICCKSEICEKIKLSCDDPNDKGGEIANLGFKDFSSSPKSPLSPKKPWENKQDFNRGDRDGMFSIGQSMRIRVGPLKGYLCRVVAIHRTEITVKLDSQHKVLTVKGEHLSEVRGKSSDIYMSGNPESASLKPFGLLGTDDCSQDWMGGVGTSAGSDGWATGALSAERSSWPSFPASGSSLQPGSSSSNPFSSEGKDTNADVTEDTPWESKVAPKRNSSWGAEAAADVTGASGDQVGGWGKSNSWDKASSNTGFDGSASNSWDKSIVPGDVNKNNILDDNQGNGKTSEDPWDKGKNVIGKETSSWGAATSGKNQNESWDKGKDTESGSWTKNESPSVRKDGWNKTSSWGAATSDKNQFESLDKGKGVESGSWNKNGSSGVGNDSLNKTSCWGAAASVKNEFESADKGKDIESGSWNKSESSAVCKGIWNNSHSQKSGNDDGSAWGKAMKSQDDGITLENQRGSWGNTAVVKCGEKDGLGASTVDWSAPKASEGNSSGWNQKSTDSDIGEPKSNWNSGSINNTGNQNSNWSKSDGTSESGVLGPHPSSTWGKTSKWKSGSDAGKDGESSWVSKGKINFGSSGSGGNQDSDSGKKSNWNSASGEPNWSTKGNTNFGSSESGGNQGSEWGKKSNWNSGSGESNWGAKGKWNSSNDLQSNDSTGGGETETDTYGNRGGRGNWRGRGGFGGRDNSDTGGGYRGRGRGNYGGRNGDGGGFQGRGRSEGGFSGGRGGSDRGGGRGGRGCGRRDFSGGWNNDSSEDKPYSWSSEANNSEGWRSNCRGSRDWKQGGDAKGEQKSWNSGSGGWGNNSGDDNKPSSWNEANNSTGGWKSNNTSSSWGQGSDEKNQQKSWNSGLGDGNFNRSEDKSTGGWKSNNSSGTWNKGNDERSHQKRWNSESVSGNSNPGEDKSSGGWKSNVSSGTWGKGNDEQSHQKKWSSGGRSWNNSLGEDNPSGSGGVEDGNKGSKSNADSGPWNQSAEKSQKWNTESTGSGTWNKGLGSSSTAQAGGSDKPPSGSGGGEKGSGSGWGSGSDAAGAGQSTGWNQSNDTKEGTNSGEKPTNNSLGKGGASSSWGTSNNSGGKGGW